MLIPSYIFAQPVLTYHQYPSLPHILQFLADFQSVKRAYYIRHGAHSCRRRVQCLHEITLLALLQAAATPDEEEESIAECKRVAADTREEGYCTNDDVTSLIDAYRDAPSSPAVAEAFFKAVCTMSLEEDMDYQGFGGACELPACVLEALTEHGSKHLSAAAKGCKALGVLAAAKVSTGNLGLYAMAMMVISGVMLASPLDVAIQRQGSRAVYRIAAVTRRLNDALMHLARDSAVHVLTTLKSNFPRDGDPVPHKYADRALALLAAVLAKRGTQKR